MTSSDIPDTPEIPRSCPRCGSRLKDNVVVVTDPETGDRSVRCCTIGCGWRDDEPDDEPDDDEGP